MNPDEQPTHGHRSVALTPAIREALRALPGVDAMLGWSELAGLTVAVRAHAVRRAVEEARSELLAGRRASAFERDALVEAVMRHAGTVLDPTLRAVINATGVLLHTNLGRAPIPPRALLEDVPRAGGYTNLEMVLESGERGGRGEGVVRLLRRLSGCEDAIVVNNCAAAVLLTISALASGREVVVSRGELVEIGGSFRVPEVISQGGAILREVGTTNRTRASDYAAAVGPNTAGFLKAHASNFQIVGFTEDVSIAELVALARARSEGRASALFVVEDLGSATFLPLVPDGSLPAPTPRAALEAGADVVCFSGDKLLGGPQSGILVGRSEAIGRARKHPLYRALRPGKLTLAVLEATLRLHLDESGRVGLPLHRMAAVPVERLEARARALQTALADVLEIAVTTVPTEATLGGGSIPGQKLPSRALQISLRRGDAEPLARALRLGRRPVVGLVRGGQLVLDLRAVAEEEDADLAEALREAVRAVAGAA